MYRIAVCDIVRCLWMRGLRVCEWLIRWVSWSTFRGHDWCEKVAKKKQIQKKQKTKKKQKKGSFPDDFHFAFHLLKRHRQMLSQKASRKHLTTLKTICKHQPHLLQTHAGPYAHRLHMGARLRKGIWGSSHLAVSHCSIRISCSMFYNQFMKWHCPPYHVEAGTTGNFRFHREIIICWRQRV